MNVRRMIAVLTLMVAMFLTVAVSAAAQDTGGDKAKKSTTGKKPTKTASKSSKKGHKGGKKAHKGGKKSKKSSGTTTTPPPK